MAMVGNLKDFSLSTLLHLLGRGGKTGELAIWSPNGLYSIWLYQGRVVTAISPDERCRLQHMLDGFSGSTLISSELTDKMASKFCNTTETIGMCLKRQDLVSPIVLAQIFRQQLKQGVYCLFGLEEGRFSFTNDAPLPYGEMTGMSKAATEVALEGLRTQSEANTPSQTLPAANHRFFRVGDGLPMLQLSPLEWSVWEQVSPYKTVKEISLFLEEDLLQVRQICSRFLGLGLIEACPTMESNQPKPEPFAIPVEGRIPSETSGSSPKEPAPQERPSSSLLSRLAMVLKGIRS